MATEPVVDAYRRHLQIVEKIWGHTIPIVQRPDFSLYSASANAGFRCSKHLHQHRWNGFHCLSGALQVRVYDDQGRDHLYVLGAGDFVAVPPGVKHRFEAVSDTIFLETYWPAVGAIVDPEDIVRDDEGGRTYPDRG